jgi:hypothetical protein
MPARYHYHISHGRSVSCAVRVNGITIHHGATEGTQDGLAGPIDHFLEPGENRLEVDIRLADPGDEQAHFYAGVFANEGDVPLALLEWPKDFPPLPEPAPPFPTLQLRLFAVPDDHPKPLFSDARAERVPLDGTDETWAPVRALHAAFERGDAGTIGDLLSMRVLEAHKFYDLPETTEAGARQLVAEGMAGGPYDMLPLYGGQVVFQECAGGRAVQLIRPDGRPAIFGRCRANPKQAYISNPVLVRHQGAYRFIA